MLHTMNKIEMSKNPDYCFAALKLIEQLYKDGKIPNFMYRNILNEYADIVDVAAFVIGNSNKKEEVTV